MGDRLAALNQGRIQQVGRPHEIHDAPANVFVAGFLGYPPMNLLQAQIRAEGIDAGPLQFPASPNVPDEVQRHGVTVGVRPEHVTIAIVGNPGDGAVSGIVRLVEPAGPTCWVTVEFLDQRDRVTVTGTAASGCHLKIGDRVTVSVRGPAPHLFDPSTGRRYGSS